MSLRRSPEIAKRGVNSCTLSGSETSKWVSWLVPRCVSLVRATPVILYRVSESGSVNSACARPRSSVRIWGNQAAVSRKSRRSFANGIDCTGSWPTIALSCGVPSRVRFVRARFPTCASAMASACWESAASACSRSCCCSNCAASCRRFQRSSPQRSPRLLRHGLRKNRRGGRALENASASCGSIPLANANRLESMALNETSARRGSPDSRSLTSTSTATFSPGR